MTRLRNPDSRPGWLLLFVILLGMTAVTGLIFGGLLMIAGADAFERGSGLLGAAVAGYTAFCVRLLWRRDQSAVGHARRLMVVWIATSIFIIASASATGHTSSGAGRPLLFALIWLPYLRYSKRVGACGEMPLAGPGRLRATDQLFASRAACARTLRTASAMSSMSRRGPSSIVWVSQTASEHRRSFWGH